MKYILITIQIFTIVLYANAQNNSVTLIKYKELKSNIILGTYNHWFDKDRLVSLREPNFRNINMRGFPVLINDIMTTQTDTTKYNKEFNEFVNEQRENEKKRARPVWMRYYKSDVMQMTFFDDSKNKNYVVLDSLDNMNTWEILNDTLTILGFKCQKAKIVYNQENYTAWFTTQLPYNAGPDVFRGLPGLIIKVSNLTGNKGYEAIEIETPYKGELPIFKTSAETISKREFQALSGQRDNKMRESLNNLMEQLKTPEGKQALINQYRKQVEAQKP